MHISYYTVYIFVIYAYFELLIKQKEVQELSVHRVYKWHRANIMMVGRMCRLVER